MPHDRIIDAIELYGSGAGQRSVLAPRMSWP